MKARQKSKVGSLTVKAALAIARRACRPVRDFDCDDMVQECLLEMIKHSAKVTGKAKAYGYCRMRVRHYWQCINNNWKDGQVTWRELGLDSLNEPIEDGEGNLTEKVNLIADSYSLQRQVEVITFLKGLPPRIKRLAQRKLDGVRLTNGEKTVLAGYAKQIY